MPSASFKECFTLQMTICISVTHPELLYIHEEIFVFLTCLHCELRVERQRGFLMN